MTHSLLVMEIGIFAFAPGDCGMGEMTDDIAILFTGDPAETGEAALRVRATTGRIERCGGCAPVGLADGVGAFEGGLAAEEAGVDTALVVDAMKAFLDDDDDDDEMLLVGAGVGVGEVEVFTARALEVSEAGGPTIVFPFPAGPLGANLHLEEGVCQECRTGGVCPRLWLA